MISAKVAVRRQLASCLDVLINRQHKVQRVIEHKDVRRLEGRDLVEYIKMNVIACTDELHEVLGETGWKHWKTDNYGTVKSRQRYIDECADVILFVINLLLAQRVTGMEILKALEAKWLVNQERQRRGY